MCRSEFVQRCAIGAIVCWLAGTAPAFAIDPVDCKFAKDGAFKSRQEYRAYLLHQASEEHKFLDRNCDGDIDDSERKKYSKEYVALLEEKIRQKVRDFEREARMGRPFPAPAPKAKDPLDCDMSPRAGWRHCLIVRDSFEDIAIFSDPKRFKAASGAQFNWAHDRVADNTVWSAKGVVAYPIAWTSDDSTPRGPVDPYLVGFALTPSVTFNRLSNSNASLVKKNVDVLTYNAGGELGIGRLFIPATTHYFRGRFGVQSDSTGVTQSRNLTLEYQPLTSWRDIPNLSSPNTLPFLPLTYQVDPILRYQYFEASAASDLPLFASRRTISRLGPVVALSVMAENVDTVPDWLKNVNFNLAYSWLRDVDTGTQYRHFLASLGFSLDAAGHFGVKVSYETGKVEETGQDVTVTRVGLTAKF